MCIILYEDIFIYVERGLDWNRDKRSYKECNVYIYELFVYVYV